MKIGLVLGGGGAKGSYQIGVVKALIEYKIIENITDISGTSIGAVNALMVMSKMNIDEMINLWHQMTNEKIYLEGFEAFRNAHKGAFNINKLYEILTLNQDVEVIKNSKIDGFAAVVSIEKDDFTKQINKKAMRLEIIKLNDAINPYKIALASASVPLLFGPTIIDDRYYIDGGLISNIPIEVMIENKCDIILVVGLKPNKYSEKYQEDALIIDFSPIKKLGLMPKVMLDFSKKSIDNMIALGYQNTILMLNYLKDNGYLNDNGTLKTKEKIYLNLDDINKVL